MPAGSVAANYRHYEPRTCHGSSLSPAIHAAVAARCGFLDDAEQYFRMSAGVDLDDRMGNAAQGVHIATMGGLWQAAVIGFGGVGPDGDSLRVDPRLPPSWNGLSFPVRWRGTRVDVEIRPDGLRLTLDGPAVVAAGTGPAVPLAAGCYGAGRSDDGWSSLEAG
jgi:kojibiose phosphorylase